eukprot:6077827-Pyramimonas_sp.AAC.1
MYGSHICPCRAVPVGGRVAVVGGLIKLVMLLALVAAAQILRPLRDVRCQLARGVRVRYLCQHLSRRPPSGDQSGEARGYTLRAGTSPVRREGIYSGPPSPSSRQMRIMTRCTVLSVLGRP